MPREAKKRGRREQSKRKREGEEDDEHAGKRRATEEIDDQTNDDLDNLRPVPEIPFYGMLTDSEQEYFKNAEAILESNPFANDKGSFLYLAQHRFASHCCETLLLTTAPLITLELGERWGNLDVGNENELPSMENIILDVLGDLQDDLGFLLTDRFATHSIRLILITLSGKALGKYSINALRQSKQEIFHLAKLLDQSPEEFAANERAVPASFPKHLGKFTSDIITGLSSTELRALAIHPTGSPALQLLLELRYHGPLDQLPTADNDLLSKLLPDDLEREGNESLNFFNGLVYDSVGSHLAESIVTNAPAKRFKVLYRTFFKPRLEKLVKNETASYVVRATLCRLSAKDLEGAVSLVVPQIPMLLQQLKPSLIKIMIDRCVVRKVDVTPIAEAICQASGDRDDAVLLHILQVKSLATNDGDDGATGKSHENTTQVHGSLLAQSMLRGPRQLRDIIFNGLVSLPVTTTVELCQRSSTSRLLQLSLTHQYSDSAFRRKFINRLVDHVNFLALNPVGSHFVDALWPGTRSLPHVRERIAQELVHKEVELRESHHGRAIWKNWKLDLYVNRKSAWLAKAKAADVILEGSSSLATPEEPSKTGMQLARQKFAFGSGVVKSRETNPKVRKGHTQ
ncbi:MAG: Nucleolar protein 9 [Piccolia ochrophora]|nr:MAG: Nucleolar protein 9 [Piccolia ochrophora]